MVQSLAIIGGGWSGLACAVRLIERGARVTLFEAANTLGGRARGVSLDTRDIDNGQHILIGAYTETLALMATVGVSETDAFLRLPLTLHFPGALTLKAPPLPAPLHTLAALLTARGFSLSEKFAAARFMAHLAWIRYRPDPTLTVADLLARTHQPARVVALLWDPLCVAALNTPIQDACALAFCAVLRDSLTGPRAHSDLLLPRRDLTALFPGPAAQWLIQRGANIQTGQRITRIEPTQQGVTLHPQNGQAQHFDQAIIATAPHHAARLLDGLADTTRLDALQFEPILTCYLQYPKSLRLPAPMVGVESGTAQWLFDRGQISGQHGMIAAIISARPRHLEHDKEALRWAIHADVLRAAGDTAPPKWHQIITEKRATFSCRPGLTRPDIQTGIDGLWLCGDYLDPHYPATLESASRCATRATGRALSQQPR